MNELPSLGLEDRLDHPALIALIDRGPPRSEAR